MQCVVLLHSMRTFIYSSKSAPAADKCRRSRRLDSTQSSANRKER